MDWLPAKVTIQPYDDQHSDMINIINAGSASEDTMQCQPNHQTCIRNYKYRNKSFSRLTDSPEDAIANGSSVGRPLLTPATPMEPMPCAKPDPSPPYAQAARAQGAETKHERANKQTHFMSMRNSWELTQYASIRNQLDKKCENQLWIPFGSRPTNKNDDR